MTSVSLFCFRVFLFFFFSSRRRHTRCSRDWSSDVCSSDLVAPPNPLVVGFFIYKTYRLGVVNKNYVTVNCNLLDVLLARFHKNIEVMLRYLLSLAVNGVMKLLGDGKKLPSASYHVPFCV